MSAPNDRPIAGSATAEPTTRRTVDGLRIGTPCPMRWDDLRGDGAKRFCGECRLHVYDFAQMTAREIEDVTHAGDERVCARIVKRADGTILTKDCGPVRGRRRRLSRVAAALVGVALPFGAVACTEVHTVGRPVPVNGAGGAAHDPPAPGDPPKPDPEAQPPELLGDVICDPPDDTEPEPLLGEVAWPHDPPSPEPLPDVPEDGSVPDDSDDGGSDETGSVEDGTEELGDIEETGDVEPVPREWLGKVKRE